jgi:Zn finger protein HypA/HybF involved in hydrogenase expression
MPIDEVSIVRKCGVCGAEIETVAVKKDNMMLSTTDLIWCPACESERPEVRDIAGRTGLVRQEQESYPQSVIAVPFGSRPAAGG